MKRKHEAAPAAQDESEPSDQRIRRSKEAVLAATFTLLTETGFGGASIDEVSRRSGVAKTTIYRHWPSRSALLLDACAKLGSKPLVPDTGSLRDDVSALALGLAAQLAGARWAVVLPSIIDAAERDPEIAALHGRLNADLWMAAFRTVIERAQERKELPRDREPSAVIASLVGPLFYRRWFSREALDEPFVRQVVATALGRAGRKAPRQA